jgi:hypothetical protein
MPPVGFELTIPASARPQTYALDRAVTGIGTKYIYVAMQGIASEFESHGTRSFITLIYLTQLNVIHKLQQ